jgi:uncharacterized protein (DUF2126 family)
MVAEAGFVCIGSAFALSFAMPPAATSPDSLPVTPLHALAEEVSKRLRSHGIKLTLGGEPTYVPTDPQGSEWNFVAVGPTKLRYAYALAGVLTERYLPGAITLYSPGKSYPGEVNPRWVVNVLANRDGTRIVPLPLESRPTTRPTAETLDAFQTQLAAALKIPTDGWVRARDPLDRRRPAAVLPLDHNGKRWITDRWKMPNRRAGLTLLPAEGPAGLRLPLNLLAPEALRRALTIELRDDALHLFLPPLLQAPFKKLMDLIVRLLTKHRVAYFLEGYLPSDEEHCWTRVGLTADPGVLEINLPPCETWADYHRWMTILEEACGAVGLCSWKQKAEGETTGTGGGNHLLFGGPSLEENPFFARPGWVASLLRYLQAHPSLSYLFTGSYVGPSSQAPRPDESARSLYDLDLAYQYLAGLPPGDHRYLIGETLRHLHIDITGNTHRSEASFDKFWMLGGPDSGASGLIEFRAIESMPTAGWMSLVALLWQSIALYTLEHSTPAPLVLHGAKLHDLYFLPSGLWGDLRRVLADLRRAGMDFPEDTFRQIWEWRFPLLLSARAGGGGLLEVRRACESWPLLCETPSEGGSTSRFVDTSIERLEIAADARFARKNRVFVNGRETILMPLEDKRLGCGLRYRRTALYPSLHPGIKPHLPLELAVVAKDDEVSASPLAVYWLEESQRQFHKAAEVKHPLNHAQPCAKSDPSLLTYDLRLE